MTTNLMKRTFGVLAVGAMLALPASAGAAVITFDQIGTQGGTVQNINDTDFIGTDITFDVINFLGTAVYCDATAAANTDDASCLLNFNTQTGEFVLTAEIGLYDAAGVLLPGLDGSAVSVLTAQDYIFGLSVGKLVLGIVGTDTKLAELLDFFGLANENWTFVNSEIRTTSPFATNTTQLVENADITNGSPDIVPEPGMMALFGLGLVGLGRQIARRKKR